jgi:hypothetical protein
MCVTDNVENTDILCTFIRNFVKYSAFLGSKNNNHLNVFDNVQDIFYENGGFVEANVNFKKIFIFYFNL